VDVCKKTCSNHRIRLFLFRLGELALPAHPQLSKVTRLRIVSTDNNQILESGGYIAVLQSDITLDPKRDPTADGSSANGVKTNILTVHEASLVLQSIEMLNASILAYSYDGKRLPDHNDGRDVLASLNETQLVLFHINRSSTPPTVTLIVQR